MAAAVVVILLALAHAASGFYLPGVAPLDFRKVCASWSLCSQLVDRAPDLRAEAGATLTDLKDLHVHAEAGATLLDVRAPLTPCLVCSP